MYVHLLGWHINLQHLLKETELMMKDGSFCINLHLYCMIIQGYCDTQWFSFLVSDVEQSICLIRSVNKVISLSVCVCVCWRWLCHIQLRCVLSFFALKACPISERAVREPMAAYAVKARVFEELDLLMAFTNKACGCLCCRTTASF